VKHYRIGNFFIVFTRNSDEKARFIALLKAFK